MGFRESISKFFKRDKVAQIEKKGRGYSFDDPMGGAVDNAAGMTGMNMLTVALSMDQNLLERYADYENMDDYPELSAALDIFADDTTIPDSVRGKTIWGESPDRVVRDVIDDLLHRILRVEEDVWVVMRTLCKYGNAFGEVVVSEHGVVGVNYLPVPTMRRLVNMKGDLLGYVQDLTGQFGLDTADYETLEGLKARFEEKSMIFFEPWEIVHWRLQSKFVRSLYGYSIIDASRWIWKRLAMLEDTALVYKLTRSPSRYAFYVDTGDLPPDEAMALVKKAMRKYKKRTLVNPTTGKLEFRNNPLNPEEDLWIPTRGGKESTRVDVLSGPDWQSMEDVQYFRDKMFTAIKIPQSYFGGEAEASQGLAQRDVRFGRTCMRVQREYRNGIRQVARVHLAALGIDPDSVKWDTRMTVPSSIFELQQIEVMNAQAGLISTLSEYFPQDWLLERVLHMSKDEAAAMVNQKASEVERTMSDQARVAATIQAKYPELAIPPEAAAMAMGELPMESREVSKKLDKLHEAVNKTIQTSSRVLKRVENMEPTMARTFLKLRQVK